MRCKSNEKQRYLLLLAVLMAIVMLAGSVLPVGAAATGKCTNVETEGVEHYHPVTIMQADANLWRGDLLVEANTIGGTGGDAGDILGVEIVTTTDSTHYQCTEISAGTAIYSCNSIPVNAIISGIYFLYKPDSSAVTQGQDINFVVTSVTAGTTLAKLRDKVAYPPYPCSRNEMTRDFVAPIGESLIFNTSDECSDHMQVEFLEQNEQFAIVNIIVGDKIVGDRINMSVSPLVSYSYTMELYFEDVDGTSYTVTYTYNPNDPYNPTVDGSALDGLEIGKLPLTLTGGMILNIDTTQKDLWGNKSYPTATDFNIKFWYENTTGTLGYENSIFHFTRNMTLQFAPYCTADNTANIMTGVATSLYDPCQTSRQLFNVSLLDENGQGIVVPKTQADCDAVSWCESIYSVNPTIYDYAIDHTIPSTGNYRFVTRKCLDSSCSSYTTTSAYPYSLTVSDAQSLSRTYRSSSNSSGSTTVFKLRLYEDTSLNRPFAITGLHLMAEEPGTYVVFGFMENNDIKASDLRHYAVKFYVTVNKTEEITTCSTLANNGYFKAYWNDCLSHKETQLMSFEHIPGTEEAWIRNRSGVGVHFPYVAELSYVPQKFEVASLNCSFESIGSGGQPGQGYCRPDDIYVPPYTKVTINSGTAYLEMRPDEGEFAAAYARMDTMNISHLFFSVQIKECENLRTIPNTGVSLRSPLKVNAKVDAAADEATSYVFTGNSLRIPAIGLGMETPIPIVHVYYEEGSENLQWDLSTLGNYVGELEGGSYLPYAGNSALTGHYYSMGVFKNLGNLNLEDEIIIFGNDGIKYTYKVVQKFLAQPSDVYEMFQQIGERSLTLVTCENYNLVTDEYERRQLIRATIDSMEPYEVNW